MTDNDIWTIRQDAAERGDGELSRLCSAALWGTKSQRARARRILRGIVQ